MTVTLSPRTETLLQEQSGRLGQDKHTLADMLLQQALEEAALDYEETCQAIAEGLADMEAGRTVSFEEVRAKWEAQKVARRSQTRDAA
jgi:predicted transcriptional regulator